MWSRTVNTEEEAFETLKRHHCNTIIRKVKVTRDKKTIITTQWYDFLDKCWRDNDNNRLKY